MTSAPVPFVNQQQSGWEEIAGASQIAMNVIVDPKGAIRRRPGISAYSGAISSVIDPNGIVGLYCTAHRTLLAVGASGAERPIYVVTGGGSLELGGGAVPYGLQGTGRPVFAETELIVAIAGGGEIEKLILAGPTTERLAGSPPKASHILASSSRLLANDMLIDRAAVRFSDTAGGDTSYAGLEVWNYGGFGTSGYFTAEAKPDDVVALLDNTNEVAVVGTGTTQVFQPDATLTYAPVGTVDLGMAAPYSAVRIDQQFFWLDHRRRFVMTDCRSFEDASAPIRGTIEGIATIADCFGYRVFTGFSDVTAWTFPTDGRTFAFQKGGAWGQWSGWDTGRNNWVPLSVMSAFTLPAWSADPGVPASSSTTLVGTTNGRIGKFDMGVTTDFGAPIPFMVRTGFINRDTDKRKQCRSLQVALRRGTASGSPGPAAKLRWSDAPGEWSEPLFIDLGSSGDTEIVVNLYSLGVYRRRQWEFRYDGPEPLALVSAVEEFDVLSV